MRGTTARLSLVAAGLAVVGLVGGAHAATPAAPKPKSLVITDPSGDAMPGTKGDIVKVTYTTTGKTTVKKVRNKPVTTYTPDKLVLTIETADPVDTSGTTTYEIDSEVAGCDSGFDVWSTPGVDGSEGGGCTNADPADPTSFTDEGLDGAPTVAGKTLTFTFHFNGFSGKQVKAGATISGVHAYTALVEPVVGFIGPYLVDTALANDNLTGPVLQDRLVAGPGARPDPK